MSDKSSETEKGWFTPYPFRGGPMLRTHVVIGYPSDSIKFVFVFIELVRGKFIFFVIILVCGKPFKVDNI